MSKKWLVDYQDNTKYPQVGPRDWMNKHGWYAKEGGPYVQGRDFDPNYQQYTQYGNMYSTPQFGLMYKPENTAMWGMGNSTNLIRSDYQGFSGSAPSTDYGYDRPTTGMVTGTTGQTNEDADYSVDSVRMKKGGTTKSQKKEYKAPVLVGPQGQWSNVHTFEGMPANPQRSDYEYQIEALQQRQANTTPIGAKPTWRNKAQRVINSVNNSAPGAYSAIPTMLTYPAQAALNLTDPSRYFQGTDGNAQAGFVGAGNMIMDASAVVPFLPKGRVPKVYGESNVAPHDPYSSVQPVYREPINASGWNGTSQAKKYPTGTTKSAPIEYTNPNPADYPVINPGTELDDMGYSIEETLPKEYWQQVEKDYTSRQADIKHIQNNYKRLLKQRDIDISNGLKYDRYGNPTGHYEYSIFSPDDNVYFPEQGYSPVDARKELKILASNDKFRDQIIKNNINKSESPVQVNWENTPGFVYRGNNYKKVNRFITKDGKTINESIYYKNGNKSTKGEYNNIRYHFNNDQPMYSTKGPSGKGEVFDRFNTKKILNHNIKLPHLNKLMNDEYEARLISDELSKRDGIGKQAIEELENNKLGIERKKTIFDNLPTPSSDYYSENNIIQKYNPDSKYGYNHFDNEQLHSEFVKKIGNEHLFLKALPKNKYGGKVEQYKEGGTMKGKGWLNNFK